MTRRITGARSSGVLALLLACLLAGALFPTAASAQKQRKPSNNMWTRSARLYLDRARTNPRFEEKQELYRQALEAIQKGIEEDPGNAQVWLIAGQVYVQLDSAQQAHEAFSKAVELYPPYEKDVETERRNAWARWHNEGIGAIQQQDYERALERFQAADLIYDKLPNARLQLGALYLRMGETDRAIEAFRGALEILRGPARDAVPAKDREQWRQNEEVAAFNLAQLLANAGRYEEAEQEYRAFLEREPKNRTAKSNLAIVLTRLGRTDEANRIYGELLDEPDLTEEDYQVIGIGLLSGDEFDRAAEAFRKALALNPYSRDAMYNLAQAIYRQGLALEERRQAASGDEQVKAATDLGALYAELENLAEKLRAVDPYNRNALLLLAHAYRGQGDLAVQDAAKSDEWRAKALEVLREQENLPFEVKDLVMTPGEGKVRVSGLLQNAKLAAGTPVTIEMSIVGKDGQTVGTQEITVSAPEAEQAVSFEAEIEVSGEPAGFRYQARS